MCGVNCISPGLETLDSTQHVQVTSRVLLYHILHIVRAQGLLELFLCYMKFHYSELGRNQIQYNCHEVMFNEGPSTYSSK